MAWNRRVRRINWENLFVVLVEKDGCTHKDLLKFDQLPYKNKVALVHENYLDIKSCFVIERCNDGNQLDNIMEWEGRLGRRYYDQFNWIKFFNKE